MPGAKKSKTVRSVSKNKASASKNKTASKTKVKQTVAKKSTRKTLKNSPNAKNTKKTASGKKVEKSTVKKPAIASSKNISLRKQDIKQDVSAQRTRFIKTRKPLNIVFVASEAVPFVKTGGLADVIGALPLHLKELGHNVVVFLPEYLKIHEANFNLQDTGIAFSCPVGSDWLDVSISKAEYNGVEFFFVKYPPYFMRPNLYGDSYDYPDNLERFTLFSKAVIEALPRLDFKPDIIHCHDWHTGLVPVFLKAFYSDSMFFDSVKTVFTIHNIAYQGVFGVDKFHLLGLDWSYFTHQALEFYGKINLLKSGIIFADKISTVSPQFAEEIQTPEFGYGLDGVLRSRKHDLIGILNGIDEKTWDPWTDKNLVENFGLKNNKAYLKGKSLCKLDLLKISGFSILERPIFSIVSRLSEQKGVDILIDGLIPLLSEREMYFILLGTGDSYYEQEVMALEQRFSQKVRVFIKFDEQLAHKIYAGSDFFLMPSKYEPCGLSQMIAMRYATLPIVRSCGGLKDTVSNDVGFLFDDASANSLKSTVENALDLYYNDKKGFNAMRKKAMLKDFSWGKSAKEYDRFYHKVKE